MLDLLPKSFPNRCIPQMAGVTSRAAQGSSTASVARQIGMLGVLAGVVTILTILFNFVATLCISVVAGMMAGASRRFNWQVISVSLVPPAVALALSCIAKTELDLRRHFSLAAVCLGSFWLTWLATFLLLSLEKKSAQTQSQRTPRHSIAAPQLKTSLKSHDNALGDATLNTGDLEGHLNMGHLQGTWRCETPHPDDESKKRVLIVDRGRFSLSIMNASGQARLLEQGDVTVKHHQGKTELLFSEPSGSEESTV